MELCRVSLLVSFLFFSPATYGQPSSLRICTYNVEAYLDAPTQDRTVKTAQSRQKVEESLVAAQADVLALQEMGTASALKQLQTSLQTAGLDYPYSEHVTGSDTNIHLAILSRFPMVARRPHTNDSFLLYGRRYLVSRGFAEVDIQANPRYRFTLITAHLKSQRAVHFADEAELREEEARLLRRLVTQRLTTQPDLNLIVLGDLNDTKDSSAIRLVMGRGKSGLIDLRPAEATDKGSNDANPRSITWTHFYSKEDTYSRIDYILLSRGMYRELLSSQIIRVPDWGLASDHRPLVATFLSKEH